MSPETLSWLLTKELLVLVPSFLTKKEKRSALVKKRVHSDFSSGWLGGAQCQ